MMVRVLVVWSVLVAAGCAANVDATDEVEQAVGADLTITPSTADFGAVVAGTTSPAITFTVTNHGTVRTGPLSRALAGAGAASFTLTAGCGNRLAPGASCTFGVKFKPTSPGVVTANVTIAGSPGGAVTASLAGTGVAPAALAIAPASYNFGSVLVGSASMPASFTVTNVGGSATGVPTVTVPGAFTIAGTTCVAPLAPGATCVVTATFTPGSAGAKSGDLKVKATPGGTATAALAGTALRPGALAITPSMFDFGTAVVGTTTATGTFTVTNTGGSATGVPSLTLTGGNAAAFQIVANGCAAALAPGASCNVGVRFAPSAGGAQTATLAVAATNGGNAVASLAGTGVAPAVLAMNPTTASFGAVVVGNTSAPMLFTISNTGGAASGNPAVIVSGGGAAAFSIVGNTCVGPLAAGATCTVAVRFAPPSVGAVSASLAVAANPGGTVVSALAGSGIAPGQLVISPSTQDFGTVALGQTSSTATFTVSNVGGAPTGALATTLTGSDSAAFSLTSNCTVALAPGATCAVNVQFSPTSAGAKSASLLVSASPGGSVSAALAGTGLAPASLSIAPAFRDFGNVLVGTSSSPATFTVTNTGGQVSGVPAVQLGDSASFLVVANSCGVALAPGASCTIAAQFAPASTGVHAATLTVAASPGGAAAASLAGTGVAPGQLVITPTTADFGAVLVGQVSTTFVFTVQNTGGSVTGMADVTITGTDAASFTYLTDCTLLAPGASCVVHVQFAPTASGVKTASLSVAATPGGTATAALAGTGIAPAALVLVPAAVDFGTVVVGDTSAVFAFTILNNGGAPSGVPTTTLTGPDVASFTIVATDCTSSLAPAATCAVHVRFAPTSSGVKTGTLGITATPGGTIAAALAGTAVAPSSLVITPSIADFGVVAVGSSSAGNSFTVTNTGGVPSGVASVAVTGGGAAVFSITSNGCEGIVLAAGASCLVVARFAPVSPGVAAASLAVSATPGGTASAALTGTGVAPAQLTITPTLASFGAVTVGAASPTFVFTVSNNGGFTAGTPSFSIGGSDAAQFSLVSNTCASPLPAFASCTIGVRFTPVATGLFTATLTGSASPGGTVMAALSGSGI